ncbi:hypothetical protein M3Y97_00063800 [Aphelenchoides bicaudatus]|nr:hypothetical protein M3Y97_00063800 [Aphelenchoides bicaudatus]
MDAKLLCVLVLFALLFECQGQKEFANNNECQSSDATLYVYQMHGIEFTRYTNGERGRYTYGAFSLGLAEAHALAFDYMYNEILFVEKTQLDTVFGSNQVVEKHKVLQEKGAQFDKIIVDPITNNLYFADNQCGIGVCTGHSTNTSCILLVAKREDTSMVYTDLILYWQQGSMFWIETEDQGKSQVVMASMSGQHIRVLSHLESAKSLALNSQSGVLYAVDDESTVALFSVYGDKFAHFQTHKLNKIFVVNCELRALERHSEKSEGIYNAYASKIFLEQDKTHKSNVDFPDVAAVLVLDSDLIPKPNPCKHFHCNGICVLAESFAESLPTCISIASNQPRSDEVAKVMESVIEKEKIVEKKVVEGVVEEKVRVEVQMKSNPVNGVLIAVTVISLLLMIFFVAFAVSSSFRLKIREQLCFGKKSTTTSSHQQGHFAYTKGTPI